MFGGLDLLDTKVLASSTAQDVGRRLANIPLTQFSLMSKYQLTDQLAVGGTATYGGEIYGGHLAANAANNHTVDWWRFDAFAEYEISKNWEIEVSVSTSRMSSTTMRSTRPRFSGGSRWLTIAGRHLRLRRARAAPAT
ncbi:MAG: TonB-dependent receptor [Hyphomicrobium sp.]